MKPESAFSRRSLMLSGLVLLPLLAAFDLMVYTMTSAFAETGGAESLPLVDFLTRHYGSVLIPASVAVWVLWTLVLWRGHAAMFRSFRKPQKASSGKRATLTEDPAVAAKTALNRDRRFYVHLLGLMQREGRLVDFLFEDLDAYEDAQIGAAARSVHAGSRKALGRVLKLGPLLDEPEGSPITVAPEFDPGTLTLTGNVVGDPPFSGRVCHRGWRVETFNLPDLSASEDAAVIAPAEVEIS